MKQLDLFDKAEELARDILGTDNEAGPMTIRYAAEQIRALCDEEVAAVRKSDSETQGYHEMAPEQAHPDTERLDWLAAESYWHDLLCYMGGKRDDKSLQWFIDPADGKLREAIDAARAEEKP